MIETLRTSPHPTCLHILLTERKEMKHVHCPDIESIDAVALGLEGAEKMKVKFLSENSVWIDLEPGGYTPEHRHSDKERIIVMSGEGTVNLDGKRKEIEPNTFIEFQADELHQVTNNSNEVLSIICFRNQA
ncbi:MAG: cupin domain-containing protein [Desulfobacterales bacterium]